MKFTANTLGVAFAVIAVAAMAFALLDSVGATDTNTNRTPKATVCTYYSYKTSDGKTVKSCAKKPNCVCPPGYH